MKTRIDKAIGQMHNLLGAIENLYDNDLMVMASNALLPIYFVLKSKQGIEQSEPRRADRHLRVIRKEN